MHGLDPALERESLSGVVLVEGVGDQGTVEALAERYGRDLDAEGISVVAMGGAQAIGSFLAQYPRPLERLLAHL